MVVGVYGHYGSLAHYTPDEEDYRWMAAIVKKAWNKELKSGEYLYNGLIGAQGPVPPGLARRDFVGMPKVISLGVLPPGNSPYKLSFPGQVTGFLTLIIYGEIKYADIVDKKQGTTQFCYTVPPTFKSAEAVFYACEKFNDMK